MKQSYQTVCFRCGAHHDFYDDEKSRMVELHRDMNAFDMRIRREERARVRKALAEVYKVVKNVTPGNGEHGDDTWVDGAKSMYEGAKRRVRR